MALKLAQKASFVEGNIPPGGTCLSTFVVISTGGKILVGRMAEPATWVKRFFMGERFAPEYLASGKFLLPARHLAWYESPLDAAHSVVQEQVGLKASKSAIKLLGVQSHLRGEIGSAKRPAHWDICFIYGLKLTEAQGKKLRALPWFKDLGFRPPRSLSVGDFTRGHGDILQEAGLIR